MNIFATAERHMSWLGARQAQASMNIANADTPLFKSRQIVPFAEEMKSASVQMVRNNPAHLGNTRTMQSGFVSQGQDNEEVTLSGNDVVMEKEMRVVGENSRLFAFDIGLLKSFHRMLLASVKG